MSSIFLESYHKLFCLPFDDEFNFEHCEKGALAGDPSDMFQLGNEYYDSGIYSDDKKAHYWWKKAAEAGHKDAMFNLACFYLREDTENPRIEEGIQWLKKSASLGQLKAIKYLTTKCLEILI